MFQITSQVGTNILWSKKVGKVGLVLGEMGAMDSMLFKTKRGRMEMTRFTSFTILEMLNKAIHFFHMMHSETKSKHGF